MIVIGVGLLTLFGHFINNDSIQSFVDKDALQWFDIIASFAVFLGALNMLKLQLIKIIKKQKNWQYSILAVIGFAFAIFAGFFYRGANFITLSDVKEGQLTVVSQIIAEELNESNPYVIQTKLEGYQNAFEIDKIYMTSESATSVMEKLNPLFAHGHPRVLILTQSYLHKDSIFP
jgi:uncharacterized protein with PQ loop repeat